MAFVYMVLAICAEIVGTTCLKLSAGLSKPLPTVAMALSYAATFAMLGLTLKTLPVGFVYAIWSGVGTAAIAVIGVYLFDEAMTAVKVASIGLIVAGVVGLNLAEAAH